MSAAWSESPFPQIVQRGYLGEIGEDLGGTNGEARRVCRLPDHPGWMFKEYLKDVPGAGIPRLDRLIGLPGGMSAVDRAIVDNSTSWPVARVVDGTRSVGVVIPEAPPAFSRTRSLPSGRQETSPVEIDLLALPAERQEMRGLPAQSLAQRTSVCAGIAAVGDLFERHHLVYLDWSYANVFWAVEEERAYVIDLDGSSFEPRLQIESPDWEDPLVPMGHLAGSEVDRYRAALLVSRCLTGIRQDRSGVLDDLAQFTVQQGPTRPVAELLIAAMNARRPADRPSLTQLNKAFPGRVPHRPDGPGGVVGWRPVGKTKPGVWTPPPVPPPPSAPRATPPIFPGTTPPQPIRRARPPDTRSRPQPPTDYSGCLVVVAIAFVLLIVLFIIF